MNLQKENLHSPQNRLPDENCCGSNKMFLISQPSNFILYTHNIPFKEITAAFAARKKYTRHNFNILISDVNHVFARHLLESYLRLCGCKRFGWRDDNDKFIPAQSLVTAASYLIRDVVMWPFLIFRFSRLLNRHEKIEYQNFLPPTSGAPAINYLRTDHWFNLRSGGSVGHVSGVINAMKKKGLLRHVYSSDYLYEADCTRQFTLLSPVYSTGSSIPELPQINYNFQLIRNIDTQNMSKGNCIYQRYSLYNMSGVYLKYHLAQPLVLEFNGSEVWAIKNWGSGKIVHFKLLERTEKLNLHHADLIVVVSQNLKDSLTQTGIAPQKILVNPNGVSLQKFDKEISGDNIRNKYELRDKYVVGFIGTFGEWHGVVEMARAIVLFFDKHPQKKDIVKFLLIGEGNLLATVREVIGKSPYATNVIFTGRVDQTESPRYLAACDMLLSPHIGNPDGSKFFGSPTKLFEYMAMHKPIVASNLEQIGEILQHRQSAFLVPPGDITALTDAIYEVMENQSLQQSIAAGAYHKVITHFTWEMHVEKIKNAILQSKNINSEN